MMTPRWTTADKTHGSFGSPLERQLISIARCGKITTLHDCDDVYVREKPNAAKPAAQCDRCRTPRLPPTSAINCIAEHDQSASAACRACKKRRTAPSRSSPMAISYARRASPFAPVRANSSARAAQ
jgi:hypothetical protein